MISNPAQRGVLDTLCKKVCQWLATGRWLSLGTPVSPTNKTDRHDITDILLKVALNTITLTTHPHPRSMYLYYPHTNSWIFIELPDHASHHNTDAIDIDVKVTLLFKLINITKLFKYGRIILLSRYNRVYKRTQQTNTKATHPFFLTLTKKNQLYIVCLFSIQRGSIQIIIYIYIRLKIKPNSVRIRF